MKSKATILFITFLYAFPAFSQNAQFSLATDFTVVHSFKKHQQYWTIGQSIATHFHFTPKDGAYAMFIYSGKGKFTNHVIAPALDINTLPQELAYTNKAELNFNHLSLGWKRYFKGTYNSEYGWNLYGYGGFGLMFGKVFNTQSPAVDTFYYHSPVLAGKNSFKRLTLDLALGFEVPAGGGVNFYVEGRTLIPTTEYPSRYLFVNKDAPFTGSANLGIRILFD